MRRLLTVGLVLALAGMVVAQDAPRSIAAQRALTRHDQAMRKAEQEYQRAAVAATRELIAELEQAKAQAMQAGQLDEANAIQAAIDEANEELNRLLGKPQALTEEDVAGTRWQWHDQQFGSRAWFQLNADGTVTAGWHQKKGEWKLLGDRRISAKITATGNRVHTLRVASDLRSAVLLESGREPVAIKRLD
jgi:hypothetical protein